MRLPVSIHIWPRAALLAWAVTTAALMPPACQERSAPPQTVLNTVRTATLNVSGAAFGVAFASQQKNVAFVSLNPNSEDEKRSIGVLLGVLDTTELEPTLLHNLDLYNAYTQEADALGVALTHDGKYLLIAAGEGAIIVDAARAAAGFSDFVVGGLNGTVGNQRPGNGAFEVTISPDDKYAFVSQEYGSEVNGTDTPGNVDVFRLESGKDGCLSGEAIGPLNLYYAVVGTALSPDGRTMYAASESANVSTARGILSVIDVPALEMNPTSKAIRANVAAGCEPVRAIVSSDGKTVWLTARASNYLLAFDAEKLASQPNNALIASVQVGTSPVGLTFARNETRILTADSNRFDYPGAVSGLSVIDVAAALAGKSNAVLGRIPTGLFPREFAVSPDGNTILVSDYSSSQVQAVDVSTLP